MLTELYLPLRNASSCVPSKGQPNSRPESSFTTGILTPYCSIRLKSSAISTA